MARASGVVFAGLLFILGVVFVPTIQSFADNVAASPAISDLPSAQAVLGLVPWGIMMAMFTLGVAILYIAFRERGR